MVRWRGVLVVPREVV
ncbi:hypothetical protein LINPERPRIM_LOCUS8542 [Linum perenne]